MPKFVVLPNAVERALDAALRRALTIQHEHVANYVEKLRQDRPYAPPGVVARLVERRYLAGVTAIGAAAGGASALPGVGTAASVAGGAAEIAAFVEATALYALATAEVYGMSLPDPEQRRALVVAVLVGEPAVVGMTAAGGRWADVIGRRLNETGARGLNGRLARHLLLRAGTRQGALLVGRALPLGVGAGIGAVGNRALARDSIKTARKIFGPPPRQFGPRSGAELR